jgi:uncharacterized protein (TIRG00374 family)
MKGTIIRATISLATLAVILWFVDFKEVWSRIQEIGLGTFSLCTLIAVALCAPGGLRWQAIISSDGHDVEAGWAIRVTLIGQFFNQILPSSVGGDFFRAIYLVRNGGSFGAAIRSVLVDRVAGLAYMLLLGGVMFPLMLANVGINPPTIVIGGTIVGGVAGLVVVLTINRLPFSCYVTRRKDEAGRLQMLWKIVNEIYQLAPSTKAAMRRPMVAITSLTMISGYCIIVGIEADAIHAPITFLQVLMTLPMALVISAIPISFAGWGLREGLLVVILGLFGIDVHTALAISVLFGLTIAAGSMVGGVLWLFNLIDKERADRAPPNG